jgi:hypothetical protein
VIVIRRVPELRTSKDHARVCYSFRGCRSDSGGDEHPTRDRRQSRQRTNDLLYKKGDGLVVQLRPGDAHPLDVNSEQPRATSELGDAMLAPRSTHTQEETWRPSQDATKTQNGSGS